LTDKDNVSFVTSDNPTVTHDEHDMMAEMDALDQAYIKMVSPHQNELANYPDRTDASAHDKHKALVLSVKTERLYVNYLKGQGSVLPAEVDQLLDVLGGQLNGWLPTTDGEDVPGEIVATVKALSGVAKHLGRKAD
jgi:hypothetical protein